LHLSEFQAIIEKFVKRSFITNPQNNESSVVFSKTTLNRTTVLFRILLIGPMLRLFDLMSAAVIEMDAAIRQWQEIS
jgi:hypothetical protein